MVTDTLITTLNILLNPLTMAVIAVATDGWVEGYTHGLGGTARQTS